MGNCMRSGRRNLHEEDDHGMEEEYDQEQEWGGSSGKERSNDHSKTDQKGGVKVKIVLTKEELEWLMFQLEGNEGKKLEDVLQEIEKERVRVKTNGTWRPSLESIMENPEGLEIERL